MIAEGQSFWIDGGTTGELNRERAGAIVLVQRGNGGWGLVPTGNVGNFAERGGPTDVIEPAIARICRDIDDSASARQKILYAQRLVILIEGEIADPIRAIIGMEVSVSILSGKIGVGVPDAS